MGRPVLFPPSSVKIEYPFTIHGSRFTTHDSRLTILKHRFTIHYSRLTIHGSQLTIHDSRLTILDSRLFPSPPMNSFIEIRTLNLKPGTRDDFQRLYVEKSLPLLKRWNQDVVAHGPSVHDADTYYVIRRFDSLRDREQSEDAFYSSDDWRKGPREAILSFIESYYDVVLELDEATIQGLRNMTLPK